MRSLIQKHSKIKQVTLTNRFSANERGEITLEFLALSVGFFIPVVYLIILLFQVQAATFALESGLSQASRVLSFHPTEQGSKQARLSVELALTDQGFDAALLDYQVSCLSGTCPGAGAVGQVSAQYQVPLPVIPPRVQKFFHMQIPVQSKHLIKWGQHSA